MVPQVLFYASALRFASIKAVVNVTVLDRFEKIYPKDPQFPFGRLISDASNSFNFIN